VRLFALAMTALALARIVEDTTFTTSPARFVGTAAVAALAWAVYATVLAQQRRKALRA
jgi:hypothetical protein